MWLSMSTHPCLCLILSSVKVQRFILFATDYEKDKDRKLKTTKDTDRFLIGNKDAKAVAFSTETIAARRKMQRHFLKCQKKTVVNTEF